MSWAEIKKAVNSRMGEMPLDDWIDKVGNDYTFINMNGVFTNEAVLTIPANTRQANQKILELTGKNRIYCFAVTTSFGRYGGSYGQGDIKVEVDGTNIVNMVGNVTSLSLAHPLSVAYLPISSDFGCYRKVNPFYVENVDSWLISQYNDNQVTFHVTDYKNRKRLSSTTEYPVQLLPYAESFTENQEHQVWLDWPDPITGAFDCNTSFKVTTSGVAYSTNYYMKALVIYQPLE